MFFLFLLVYRSVIQLHIINTLDLQLRKILIFPKDGWKPPCQQKGFGHFLSASGNCYIRARSTSILQKQVHKESPQPVRLVATVFSFLGEREGIIFWENSLLGAVFPIDLSIYNKKVHIDLKKYIFSQNQKLQWSWESLSEEPLKKCGLSAFTSVIHRQNLHNMRTQNRSLRHVFVQLFSCLL